MSILPGGLARLELPGLRLKRIVDSGRPNILWGAGWAAVLTKRFLEEHGVAIDAIVVDRPLTGNPAGLSIQDSPHNTPEQIARRYGHVNLICGFYSRSISVDFAAKMQHLTELGVDVVPYDFDLHVMMYPERSFRPEIVYAMTDDLVCFAATLADDLSRTTLSEFVKQRITLQYGGMEAVMVDHQYFPDNVYRLRGDEVFIDCGAYDGDTVNDFLAALERQRGRAAFTAVVAFEPNPGPFSKLRNRFVARDRITCINKGVWNESAELRFSTGRLRSSKIDDHGDALIQLDTIDAMVSEYPCSLIKLDLEGAELQALQGAEGVIRRYRPRIAVCVYHKNDDLVTIPSWIRSLDLPYQYYLRAHEAKASEVVLYCIPQ